MAQDNSWMEGQRFRGTVKFWRGSFGWLPLALLQGILVPLCDLVFQAFSTGSHNKDTFAVPSGPVTQ